MDASVARPTRSLVSARRKIHGLALFLLAIISFRLFVLSLASRGFVPCRSSCFPRLSSGANHFSTLSERAPVCHAERARLLRSSTNEQATRKAFGNVESTRGRSRTLMSGPVHGHFRPQGRPPLGKAAETYDDNRYFRSLTRCSTGGKGCARQLGALLMIPCDDDATAFCRRIKGVEE